MDQASTQEPQKVWTWLVRVIGMRQYHGRSDVHPDIGKVVFPIRGVGSLVAKSLKCACGNAHSAPLHNLIPSYIVGYRRHFDLAVANSV
jgi:hypothetical protein